jgi:ferredoxin
MATTLFYYTGTGNSLWVARTLAQQLGGAELVSISDWMREKKPLTAQIIGVIFPVHMWGVPPPVLKFIAQIKAIAPEYFFAVAVDAGQVANTLVQLKGVFKQNSMTLASGFEIKMPSNYIPWGGSEASEKQEQRFTAARKKISGIVAKIKKKEKSPVEKGPLWQRGIFTLLYKLSFPQIPKMDRSFWVDEKCNHCGICSQVCPAQNISLVEGKPTWNHHCEQCLACIQWCPREAIQYGKKTPPYKRYHHPEIQLKDVLHGKREKERVN